MKNRVRRELLALAALVSVAFVVPQPVTGQAAGSAQAFSPPRTPDGQPDMQGVWRPIPNGSYSIENLELQSIYQARRPNPALRGKSRIIDPPDGKIPYQPWAAAKAKDILDHHLDPLPQHLDPAVRCVVQGVPRGMYQGEYEIIQAPGYVVFLIEAVHQYRVIPLDGRPNIPEQVELFMGSSRGRWEGNTLVVTSANFNNLTWFDIVGSFHSNALKLVERLTFTDLNTIGYQVTVEDPKVYTRPWTMASSRERMTDYHLLEEACHEGERSVNNLLVRPGR